MLSRLANCFTTIVVAVALVILATTTSGTDGTVANSDDEAKALAKLKTLIKPDELPQNYLRSDWYLLAWIRKKELNAEKAAASIRSALQWRKEQQADTVLNEDFSHWEKTYPYDMESVDKDGRVVFIYQIGRWDIRKIVISGKVKEFQRYSLHLLEKISAKIRQLNAQHHTNHTDYVYLGDMYGFNLRQHGCILCIPLNREFEVQIEKAYPEGLYKAFLLNTPTIFDRVFNTIKPIYPESLLKRISVYDSDAAKWMKVLKEYIPEDQLPVQYGGTRKQLAYMQSS